RVLLRTRNDAYPSPRSAATPYTTAGPAPGRKKTCPVCQGTGKTRLHQKCESCDGKGKFAVDGYTGRVSDESARKPQPMAPEAVDAEISRLKSSLTISAGLTDPNEAYGWERARERQLKSGSYQHLERALETLRERDNKAWTFL